MTARAKAHALALIANEMAAYRAASAAGDAQKAWHALERAHILAQPYLRLHLISHLAMLRFAIRQKDWPEMAGQIARLALAPLGALTGRNPVGNTGRANVSAFQPMSIPDDLRRAIEGAQE